MAFGLDFEDVENSTLVDLTGTNTEDYVRVDEKWVPSKYEEGGEPIVEIIPMLAIGTAANIKGALDEIDKYCQKAEEWFNDKGRKDWYRLRYREETANQDAYRLVLGGRIVPQEIIGNDTYLDKGAVDANRYRFNLELKVMPGWDIYPTNASQATSVLDRFGGQDTLSNISGSRPAIIDYFFNVTSQILFADTWIGIRDEREGLTGFTARQDLEEGDGTGTDTSEVAESNCYGTTVWETTFATETGLDERGAILLSQFDPVPTDWEDYHGRYLIILRARMTSTGKAGVQLRWGFGPANETHNAEIEVEGTQWSLYPLGVVEIPPWPNWGTTHDMRNFLLDFYAEELVSGGNLRWDAICLMPTDHLFSMSNNVLQIFRKLHLRTRRDWHPFAYGQDSEIYAKTGFAQHFQNWALPTGNSEIVVASMMWFDAGPGPAKTSPSPGGQTTAWQLYHIGKAGFPFET